MSEDRIDHNPAHEIGDSFSKFSFYTKFIILVPLLFVLIITLTSMQQEARSTLFASAAPKTPSTSESVYFSPSSHSVKRGATFDVNLKINTAQRINAGEIVLNYPSSSLEVTSVNINRAAFDVTVTNNFGAGKIHLVFGSTQPRTGDITVATISLRAVNKAQARLEFGAPISVVSFDTNMNIPITTINGRYNIR